MTGREKVVPAEIPASGKGSLHLGNPCTQRRTHWSTGLPVMTSRHQSSPEQLVIEQLETEQNSECDVVLIFCQSL